MSFKDEMIKEIIADNVTDIALNAQDMQRAYEGRDSLLRRHFENVGGQNVLWGVTGCIAGTSAISAAMNVLVTYMDSNDPISLPVKSIGIGLLAAFACAMTYKRAQKEIGQINSEVAGFMGNRGAPVHLIFGLSEIFD